MPLRLGTRASTLARWQANWVAEQLRRTAGVEVQIVHISTEGDQRTGQPIGTLGSSGVFTKELQRALLAQEVDLAVHSLKDLPTLPVAGLTVAAVPQRETVADAWIARAGVPFAELSTGARVGTGSPRRRAQLHHVRPDLQLLELRGNVDTRLRKLQEGQYDGIVLAQAGLRRLGLEPHVTEPFSAALMLPAAGQGALGLEIRSDDAVTAQAVRLLDDPATHAAVVAERTLMATLQAGCLAPVGAWARPEPQGRLQLSAVVLSADGRERRWAEDSFDFSGDDGVEAAAALGARVARQLLAEGAGALVEAAHRPG